jgi:hypothetical protein
MSLNGVGVGAAGLSLLMPLLDFRPSFTASSPPPPSISTTVRPPASRPQFDSPAQRAARQSAEVQSGRVAGPRERGVEVWTRRPAWAYGVEAPSSIQPSIASGGLLLPKGLWGLGCTMGGPLGLVCQTSLQRSHEHPLARGLPVTVTTLPSAYLGASDVRCRQR